VSHASHSNAALTPRARLRLARLIVDQRWPVPRAAERYDVSWKTRASGQSNRLVGRGGDRGRHTQPARARKAATRRAGGDLTHRRAGADGLRPQAAD